METKQTILYIHGMGGGADSRIPSILGETFSDIVCRTYDFDPEVAQGQIISWMEELTPCLVIGESLGSLHALQFTGVPVLLVSPALNAPIYLEVLAWLTLIPGVTNLFDRIYRPREGDRQSLHFTFRVLRKYMNHRKEAITSAGCRKTRVMAFIGTRDHYRRSGIVSVRTWKRYFGESYVLYDGTHFMEEEHVRSLVVSEIMKCLNNK